MGLGQWILQSPGCGREIWGDECWWECAYCGFQLFTPSLQQACVPTYFAPWLCAAYYKQGLHPTLLTLGLGHAWTDRTWVKVTVCESKLRLQEPSCHGYSPALLHLLLRRWEEYAPGSHCCFSQGPRMKTCRKELNPAHVLKPSPAGLQNSEKKQYMFVIVSNWRFGMVTHHNRSGNSSLIQMLSLGAISNMKSHAWNDW